MEGIECPLFFDGCGRLVVGPRPEARRWLTITRRGAKATRPAPPEVDICRAAAMLAPARAGKAGKAGMSVAAQDGSWLGLCPGLAGLGREAARWLDDPGTGSYVSRTLHWYRSTLAHAAPLVDERSQPRVDGAVGPLDPEDDPVGERDRARVDLLLRRVRGLSKRLGDVLELLDARLEDVRELLERRALEVAREVVV